VTGRQEPTDAPWDLAFLRVGLLVSGAAAVLGTLAVGLLRNWPDSLSVLLGAVVVTGFFSVSGLVVTWAGRIDDSYTLPAALGTFMVKMLLLVAVMRAIPVDGWVDRRVLGWTVVVGALLWSVVQARWVWVRPLYYVTPPVSPSAGATTAPGEPAGAPDGGTRVPTPVDPGTHTTRG
jgi:hypothetical protein